MNNSLMRFKPMVLRSLLSLIILFLGMDIQAHATKILWLGNSFTSTNNLPGMFQSLALSGGDSVVFDFYTPGGYTLMQHAQDPADLLKIKGEKWDFVVIQAQSQEPSFPNSQVTAQTMPYAHILDSLVKANDSCTQVVFYMTWGKKYGDTANCSGYPVICTFDGITGRLQQSYHAMADSNKALVAPVGMAWYACWHADSMINLWAPDDNHPNTDGSYLAACVFYGIIFRKSPVGLSYSPVGNADSTTFLQTTAFHTVFDSLANWNIGVFDPHAVISYTGNDTMRLYQFYDSASSNFTSIIWYFGDGESSSQANPAHVYPDTGSYPVTQIVYNNCGYSDTATQVIKVSSIAKATTASGGDINDLQVEVYPNPANDKLNVKIPALCPNGVLDVYDVCGRMVLDERLTFGTNNVDIKNLPPGVYCLLIHTGDHVFVRKLIKL